MITVSEAPIKEPMYSKDGRMSPVWIMFFNQLARVAQGKDASKVNADLLDGYEATALMDVSFTTKTDKSAVNSIGTVYQNTTGKPMLVSITGSTTVSSALIINVDTDNPPTLVIARLNVGTAQGCVTFLVMPNEYYKASYGSGTPTLIKWIEWTA